MSETPVELLAGLSNARTSLWVKRDDLNGLEYGGNKARKLPHLLREAEEACARRLVLIAPAGSHQVLATALFARQRNLAIAAVLVPQPRTDHAAEVLRAIVGLGVEVLPSSALAAPRALWRLRRRGDFLLPVGGSSAASLRGHIDAAGELADAIDRRVLPPPELLVVPLASAGTAVGLAAGLARRRLPTRVVGVCTNDRGPFVRAVVALQLARLGRRFPTLVPGAAARLQLDVNQLGRGYSIPTEASLRAASTGLCHGLTLDPAYTAKAFAAALALVARGRHRDLLFWQTHSSVPLTDLLRAAPSEQTLPPAVRALLLQEPR